MPLDLGQNGVILLSLKRCSFANNLKSYELNGGPLSDLTPNRIPNIKKISFRTGITVLADVLEIILTIGYLEYSQTNTNKNFPH